MKISSWGRLSADDHRVLSLADLGQAERLIADAQQPGLAFGMGRSYGDVGLNPGGGLWLTRGLDRLISFDTETGVLECEAGVLLKDIQSLLIPRGWSLPVTPGTQWVTVGGAIANDIHGKNHHRYGSFGDHVLGFTLQRTEGTRIDCTPGCAAGWFTATVGGLGLTGVILSARIQLKRVPGPWLECETLPYRGLDAFFALADDSEGDWEHTVSWIDCLGGEHPRGIFMRANAAAVAGRVEPSARPRRMPVVPPLSLVNRLTLRPFNLLYYQLQAARAGRSIAHYQPFFYPLDSIQDWNRMYGPRGFFQYQSVVPREAGPAATRAMLAAIARSGSGSFLAVLKTFGAHHSCGLLGFPRPGVTLALDFPNQGARTLELFTRLDAIVRECGGALYPAKDARMPRALFESGFPRWQEFLAFCDPGISSALSRRLLGR